MVADGHIFIIRKQGIVGPELLPDIRRMVNANVEIGVIADETGNVHARFRLTDQLRLDVIAVARVAQYLLYARAKLALCLWTARKPAIEHRLRQILAPFLVEQVEDSNEVEHEVPNRHTRPATSVAHGKNSER